MTVSVIIPTLNEESCLARALSRLRETSDRSRTEIIVADGGSSDRTVEIARSLADRVVEIPEPGRALQMQAGAGAATGEVLLFLHADTGLPEDWQEELLTAWSSVKRPAATAFRLGFDSGRPLYRLIAAAANLRTALTGVPHGDQAIAVSRDAFFRSGGFPPVPILEEYCLFRKLKPLGRVRVLRGSVATSTRRYERNGRLLQSLRNALILALYGLGAPPHVLARLYR